MAFHLSNSCLRFAELWGLTGPVQQLAGNSKNRRFVKVRMFLRIPNDELIAIPSLLLHSVIGSSDHKVSASSLSGSTSNSSVINCSLKFLVHKTSTDHEF